MTYEEALSVVGASVAAASLSAGDGILCALSGGADSSLLLVLLLDVCAGAGIRLEAAHLNHRLRGESADRDEAFCRERCRALGIPFFSRSRDIAAIARQTGEGIEACARRERYGYLFSLCREREHTYGKEAAGCRFLLATAHNATDNAETVLLHLCRGSGLRGLCGIPAAREDGVIRPILPLTKEDVLLLCQERGIPYVNDESNADVSYSRNRIRHLVLPQLRQVNPSLERSLSRMAKHLSEDAAYLDAAAGDARASLPAPPARDALLALPPALLPRVLFRLLKEAGVNAEETHITAMTAHLYRGGDWSLSLPGETKAVMSGGVLRFLPDTAADRRPARTDLSYRIPLRMGENLLPNGAFLLLTCEKNDILGAKKQNVYKLAIKEPLERGTIENSFFVRSGDEGETLLTAGHHKSVRKLFNEKKIPPDERRLFPRVLYRGTILWLPGLCRADAPEPECYPYAAAPADAPALWFVYREPDDRNEKSQSHRP